YQFYNGPIPTTGGSGGPAPGLPTSDSPSTQPAPFEPYWTVANAQTFGHGDQSTTSAPRGQYTQIINLRSELGTNTDANPVSTGSQSAGQTTSATQEVTVKAAIEL